MASKKKKVVKKAVKKTVKKKVVKKAPKAVPSKFYTFRQNNSFGRFDYDAGRGISVNVIVEADSVDDANSRAERIGLYFDGSGDCQCCGNRWSEQYEWQGKDSGDEKPALYGVAVKAEDLVSSPDVDSYIHYKNGQVVAFIAR